MTGTTVSRVIIGLYDGDNCMLVVSMVIIGFVLNKNMAWVGVLCFLNVILMLDMLVVEYLFRACTCFGLDLLIFYLPILLVITMITPGMNELSIH